MKFAAYLLAGMGLGLGLAYWQFAGEPAGDLSGDVALEDGAALERRLGELETALSIERYERQVLADDLEALMASIESNAAADSDAFAERRNAFPNPDENGDTTIERVRERFGQGLAGPAAFDEASREQRQINRFVEAGFSPERAQWILQREDELAMEILQARYDATQDGASADDLAALSPSQMLRQELGDADYERYLEGRGRPTSINVREVLTNSPAQAAGLAPGDQIVAYDGQRVFEMNELTNLTYEGRQGEAVPIDVIRDGQRIQLYVERGPIGVSGGGRSTRRR